MENFKSTTCCFSGHRDLSGTNKELLFDTLCKTVTILAEQGIKTFCCGGAEGFDTLAAAAVLRVREKRDINLVLIMPYPAGNKGKTAGERQEYARIKNSADKVVYTSERYYAGCFHKRNRALVDASSVCICFLRENSGGTDYTVKYAIKNGLKIINLALPQL